jgi:hypothetical protein
MVKIAYVRRGSTMNTLLLFNQKEQMKEIELPVNELKTALAGFNKVVMRSSLPVLGCIRVQPQLEGVDLQATDLDTHVTFRINTNAPADFAPCLVSITPLATVAKSAKDRIWLVQEDPSRHSWPWFCARTDECCLSVTTEAVFGCCSDCAGRARLSQRAAICMAHITFGAVRTPSPYHTCR